MRIARNTRAFSHAIALGRFVRGLILLIAVSHACWWAASRAAEEDPVDTDIALAFDEEDAEADAAEATADEGDDDGAVDYASFTTERQMAADEITMRRIRRCCCPSWTNYAIFDVLFLQRNNSIGEQPLVTTNPGEVVMTKQDLQPGIGTGVRLFYGNLLTDAIGWEIGYLGIYGMTGDALAQGEGLRLPPDLSSVVTNFGDAEEVRGLYRSTLNMAEANLFLYDCRRECHTSCCGRGCTTSCHCVDWIGGFVWAGLDEQASLTATCCDPPESSSYSVQSTTNYFGGQIGMRGRREWCRWATEGWWKAGLCGTSASQSQDPIYDTITSLEERGRRSSTDAGVAFLGNLNAALIYKVTQVWRVRAGYNLIWLTDATQAPSQWDFSIAPDAGTGINSNGTLFLHGANLGLEARW